MRGLRAIWDLPVRGLFLAECLYFMAVCYIEQRYLAVLVIYGVFELMLLCCWLIRRNGLLRDENGDSL